MTTPTPAAAASSPYPNPLNDRVHFKLNAAKMHLDRLNDLQANSEGRTLASSNVRMQAEIEIDEFFYHLIGVKDALLHEINRELHLGLAPGDVKEETLNNKLEEMLGEDAKEDLMRRINMMKSGERHPLRRINELHNQSEHRNMIPKDIVASAGGGVTNFALIDPLTSRRMNNQIIDYLTDSYERIEKLQKMVRQNILKYPPPV
jgi:hypothetical protein